MEKLNFEEYRQSWETGPHWELKREFLEMYKDVFTEDRLLCLAQAYSNVELMHCSYPTPVMQEIHELSKKLHACKRFCEEQNNSESTTGKKGKRSFPELSAKPYKFIKFCPSDSDISTALPCMPLQSEKANQHSLPPQNVTAFASATQVKSEQNDVIDTTLDADILMSIQKSIAIVQLPLFEKIVQNILNITVTNPKLSRLQKIDMAVNSLEEDYLKFRCDTQVVGNNEYRSSLYIGNMKLGVGRATELNASKLKAGRYAFDVLMHYEKLPHTKLEQLTPAEPLYDIFKQLFKSIKNMVSIDKLSAVHAVKKASESVTVGKRVGSVGKRKRYQGDVVFFHTGGNLMMKANAVSFFFDLVIKGVWISRGEASTKKLSKLDAAKKGCLALFTFFDPSSLPDSTVSQNDSILLKDREEAEKASLKNNGEREQNGSQDNIQDSPNSSSNPAVKKKFVLNGTLMESSLAKGLVLIDTSESNKTKYQKTNQSTSFILFSSASFCRKRLKISYELLNNQYRCILLIGKKEYGTGVGSNKKEAKMAASINAVENLRKLVYTLKILNEKQPEVLISPDKVQALYEGNKKAIPESNIGHQMLKKMGWSGGGIGKIDGGITEPVEATEHRYKDGLGFASSTKVTKEFKRNIQTLLKEYKSSDSLSDLIFSPEFSGHERKVIHRIAHSCKLNSKSYGKGKSRQLHVDQKVKSVTALLHALIESDGRTPKYELVDSTQRL